MIEHSSAIYELNFIIYNTYTNMRNFFSILGYFFQPQKVCIITMRLSFLTVSNSYTTNNNRECASGAQISYDDGRLHFFSSLHRRGRQLPIVYCSRYVDSFGIHPAAKIIVMDFCKVPKCSLYTYTIHNITAVDIQSRLASGTFTTLAAVAENVKIQIVMIHT